MVEPLALTTFLFIFSAVPSAPSTPRVQDLKGTTALLVWEDKDVESASTSIRLYTLETRRLRTSEWMIVREKISELYCSVDGLHPGECYSFRVYVQVGDEGERSDASAPSAPLSVPLGDLPPTSGMALSQQGSKGRQLPTQVTRALETYFIVLYKISTNSYSPSKVAREWHFIV